MQRKDSIPKLQYFKRVKEIVGSKSIVVVNFPKDLQSSYSRGCTD